jgi:predicted amidohydrolase
MNPPPPPAATPPPSLRVAAVQMVFAPSIPENLAKIERAAAAAARDGADAALFPECATTGYACDFAALAPDALRNALHQVGAVAASHRIHLLVGSPIFAGRRLYNGLLVFDRHGRLVHTYAKCQLTDSDRRWFTPGNGVSLFSLERVPATAIICHERRYPELVRLPVMAGARVVFHPNAGLDPLPVSRTKRRGRDGIPVRAFENAVFYVFANSVGPQGGGLWSAGDSKIVAPDGSVLQLADNRRETVLIQDLDLSRATRKYALDSLRHPRFLAAHWRRILPELRRRARTTDRDFRRWLGPRRGSSNPPNPAPRPPGRAAK